MKQLALGVLVIALCAKCIGFSDVEQEKLEIAPNLWLITNISDGRRCIIWSDDSMPQGGKVIVPENIYKYHIANSKIDLTVLKYTSHNEAPDTIEYTIDLTNYNEKNSNTIIISSLRRSEE
jgi:hypothetical protein